MRSLQLQESRDRFELIDVASYDVTLDLTGETTFSSRTTIRFASRRGETFLDLKPVSASVIQLDGGMLEIAALEEGRFPLRLSEGEHELVVDAVMPFRNDGEGLHRSHDPLDGRDYVYAMSFLDAAPSIFACFDQPDLKAPYTFHVTAPADWLVVGNAPGVKTETRAAASVWELEQTRPLSTYFVTLVAGPYHLLTDEHDGIPLGLSCRASLADALDRDADELFTLTKQCFDEFHRLFDIRYPFGSYHQAFVPEFNAGAMENPGCVTIRDPYLFVSKATRSARITRATTLAHEMAHQWFGNTVTPKWWDDLWLNESFAEYMGNRVTADATEFDDAWVETALSRKNWGLTADSRPSSHPVAGNGAVDAASALQDFDGISYAKGSSVLRQLASRVGDDVFFTGVRDHFTRHRFGNATMHDLFGSWEEAGAGDLGPWTNAWLRTKGMDRLAVERTTDELVRTPPPDQDVDRSHALQLATWSSGWETAPVTTHGDRTPVEFADRPVLVDPHDQTWADLTFDEVTTAALPALMGSMDDPLMRASVWNTMRNGVHQATLDPQAALEIVAAGVPTEDQDAALSAIDGWRSKLLSVVRDPDGTRNRLHEAFTARLITAEPGSGVQLAALQGVVNTATEVDWLDAALDGGLPAGVDLDRELRWRLFRRLTELGELDRADLDAHLAEESSVQSRVDHAGCVAALGTEEAKAWAWVRFTGAEHASNYELESIGRGMWQAGQDQLLAPYIDRYFTDVAATAAVRSGWMLADAAQFFYPITALTEETVAATEELCAQPELNLSMRRRLVDAGDEVRRRLAVRRLYSA